MSDTEPTHSSLPTSAALNNGITHPIHAVPDGETGHPGLSVGAATGIAVGITCTLFGLAAAICHIKANRRRAAKAKVATANEPDEDVFEYDFGKAVSVDISRHTGDAIAMGQIGKGKRAVQLQRCPTVMMRTGQKLSSEIPR